MKRIIATGIVADKPTVNGNIYPRDVLKSAVAAFNIKAKYSKINGSLLNPLKIEEAGEPSHISTRLLLNDSDMLCAEIEILNTNTGKLLESKLQTADTLIARPIMSIPSNIAESKDKEHTRNPLVITTICDIIRVQVECHDKLE